MKKLKTTHTASEAREDLYSLIRSANQGIHHEIFLRELDEPVVLLSKSEYKSWQETIDLLSQSAELKIIREAQQTPETLTEEQLKKQLGWK